MHCGFDFGTSNSALGVTAVASAASADNVDGGKAVSLVCLEDEHRALPSASFYAFNGSGMHIGRAAVAAYIDGEPGRFMRSMKSVLGTGLMEESTQIGPNLVPLKAVVGQFIRRVKARAEAALGYELRRVVQGRPVHFVDGDEEADARAQAVLESELRTAGFEEVVFQYEPVAAAAHYESLVASETMALITDIGGGTSDFSLVQITPGAPTKVLSNYGVRLGGTDFDKKLSLAAVMPLLGLGHKLVGSELVAPTWMYVDLSTPSRIAMLYGRRQYQDMQAITASSRRDPRFSRLRSVMLDRSGHHVSANVEQAKIALTNVQETTIDLDFVEAGLQAETDEATLRSATADEMERLGDALEECLRRAGVQTDDVPLAVMTGGSTEMPLVQEAIARRLPNARLDSCDRFGAVAAGLAREAGSRFG